MTSRYLPKRSTCRVLLASLVAAFGLASLLPSPAGAQGAGDAADISYGGKLYDNHWLVSGKQPPDEPNPLYPPGIKTAAGNTWRCVSCHGWDYGGKDGHLGEVSKSKMFFSLRPSAGKDASQLAAAMKAPGHAENLRGLADSQINVLARFISVGQFAFDELVVDGKSAGDALPGKDIFEGACISCHQADGKAYFQGEDGDRSSLGWVANNRPAQALHKIINGVPSADMLSLRFLPHNRLADLLAYIQTLDDETD